MTDSLGAIVSTGFHDNGPLDFKAINAQLNVDEAQGIVECFVAAVGNKDSVGDIVAHGAFDGSLRRRKPRVVWGHDWNQPIGKVLAIEEVGSNDPRLPAKMKAAGVGGLLARVQFNLKSERGREAFHSVAFYGEDQEWCVDADTEILTNRGWLRYDQIDTNDEAYVIDPELGYGRFESIEAVNVFPAKTRSLRRIETGGHSSLTTAAHRWPVRSNANGGNLAWTTTEDLRSQDAFIRAAVRSDAPEVGKYTDAFVELVGWFWTEGWRPPTDHTDAGLYVAQSTRVNPQHVASIRAALQAAFPGQWSEAHAADDMARFRITRAAAEHIEGVVGADKEPTPEFLLSLTRGQLRLLIDTCMSGDGHTTPAGQRTWYQCAETGVRSFEMLCALAGQPTNTTQQKDYGNRYGAPPQRVSLLRTGVVRPLDAIRVKGYGYKKGAERTPAVDEWVDHDGIVWCPTTPSRTWLARRNGSVYFTGNSIGYKTIKAEYDAQRQANVLQEVELFEVSPVLHGANQLTGTISIKAQADACAVPTTPIDNTPETKAAIVPERRVRVLVGLDGQAEIHDARRVHRVDVKDLLGNGSVITDEHPGLGNAVSAAAGMPILLRMVHDDFVIFDTAPDKTYFLPYHFDGQRYMFGTPLPIDVEINMRIPGDRTATDDAEDSNWVDEADAEEKAIGTAIGAASGQAEDPNEVVDRNRNGRIFDGTPQEQAARRQDGNTQSRSDLAARWAARRQYLAAHDSDKGPKATQSAQREERLNNAVNRERLRGWKPSHDGSKLTPAAGTRGPAGPAGPRGLRGRVSAEPGSQFSPESRRSPAEQTRWASGADHGYGKSVDAYDPAMSADEWEDLEAKGLLGRIGRALTGRGDHSIGDGGRRGMRRPSRAKNPLRGRHPSEVRDGNNDGWLFRGTPFEMRVVQDHEMGDEYHLPKHSDGTPKGPVGHSVTEIFADQHDAQISKTFEEHKGNLEKNLRDNPGTWKVLEPRLRKQHEQHQEQISILEKRLEKDGSLNPSDRSTLVRLIGQTQAFDEIDHKYSKLVAAPSPKRKPTEYDALKAKYPRLGIHDEDLVKDAEKHIKETEKALKKAGVAPGKDLIDPENGITPAGAKALEGKVVSVDIPDGKGTRTVSGRISYVSPADDYPFDDNGDLLPDHNLGVAEVWVTHENGKLLPPAEQYRYNIGEDDEHIVDELKNNNLRIH